MTCGIYILRFSGTDKVYIGKSKNIESRLVYHRYKLKAGIHTKKLQSAFNLFGEPKLEILLTSTEDSLGVLEDEAIEIFDAVHNGYNTVISSKTGGSSLRGEAHGNSKFTDDQIIEVFMLLTHSNNTAKDIVNLTGVTLSVINDIAKGANHTWLKQVYPQEYLVLLNKKNNRKSAKELGIIYPKIVSPEGIEYQVDNGRAFAREHNLQQTHLVRLLNGKAKTHKGWKLAP